MKTREEAVRYGLTFPEVYREKQEGVSLDI